MAFNSVPTVSNGDSWSAAQHNTYIKDNFAAVWVGTTAGDIDYYTSASAKSRLAKPSPAGEYYLGHNNTAPVWTVNYRAVRGLLNLDVPLVVGDNADRFRIPFFLNGWDIAFVALHRASGTGVPNVQIRNVSAAVDVLSTKLSIDSGETDSSTAATPAVINTSNDNVSTGQQIAIDVDVAGTNTLYCGYEITFRKP